MIELFANSGDPDQMPHSAAPDLGLHCLPITPLGVYRLQWVNIKISTLFPLNFLHLSALSGKRFTSK